MPTPHGQSDQHLADAARAGDQEALGELWMSYHPRLAAFIRSRDHRIDAEDAASFVLERTAMALRSGGGPRESVSSYLFRAARNTVADARHRTVDIDDVEEPAETVTSDPHTAVPTQAAISSALTRMRTEEAQLLSAVYLGGQAVGDAAREAGISPDTLSARLYRARRAFQAIWLQDHVEPQARLESCLPYRAQVGAIVSGHTTGAGAARFWVHVDECDDCSAAIASAQRNARSLAVGFPALGALTALDGVLPAGLFAAGTGAGAGAGVGAAGAGSGAGGGAAVGGGATGLSGTAGAGTGASAAGSSGLAGGAGAAGTVGAAGATGTGAAGATAATSATSASAGGFGAATLTAGGAGGSGAVAAGAIAGGASSAAAATFPLGLKIAAALAAVGVIVAATLAITRPWEGADATPPLPETTTGVPQESSAADSSSEPTAPQTTDGESPEPSVDAPGSDTPNEPATPGGSADTDGGAAAAGDPAGTQATGDGGQAPSGSATPEPTATPGPTTADPTEPVPPTARTTCGWSPDVECLDR